MAKFKKEAGKYSPINIYFNPSSNRDTRVYTFLSLISRYQTSFIASLVDNFLKEHGCTDIEHIQNLSREDALNMIEEQPSFKNSPAVSSVAPQMNQNGLMMLLQGLLTQNSAISFNETSIPEPIEEKQPIVIKEKKAVKKTPEENRFSVSETKADVLLESPPLQNDDVLSDDDNLIPGWENAMNSFSV